ncbi:MAG: relaxase/mobilization nuclease domain-containing protein [Nitrosomonas sp.]|nr:relaxase/mobilization nuclease domain-containing protein [Nitrosomonas sp.]
MIAKHIPVRTQNASRFARLVNYITDSQSKTERVGVVRITNCAFENMDDAVIEILATQRMNMRATSDKIYHLIISFQPDDRVNDQNLAEIEERLCEGLGFKDHQRISVVHHDTDNLHIHVAINKIHPERFTIHNPYFDYAKIAGLCEQLESEFNLAHDNHQRVNRHIDMESKAGVESLLGWIRRECLDDIKNTKTWQDLHQVLYIHGLEIKERGNGLVLVSSNGVAVKASSVDRSLSKPNLIKRLGAFELAADSLETSQSQEHTQVQAQTRTKTQNAKTSKVKTKHYQPRPLQNHVDTSRLYERYQQQQTNAASWRKEQWLILREQRDLLIEGTKQKARSKRGIIKHVQTGPLGKKALYATVSLQFKTTLNEIKRDYREAYTQLKANTRRMAWLDWLTIEAKRGNTEALAILRARSNRRNGTSSVLRDSIAGNKYNNDKSRTDGIESVTKDGTVFYIAGTTAVRDDGKRLFVASNVLNDSLVDVLQFAIKKYGNHLSVNGSDDFKKSIVQTAVQNKIRVTFDDPELERHRKQLSKQVVFQKRSKTSTHRRSL